MSLENLEKFRFPGVGQYDVPEIKPLYDFEQCEFIGFNQAQNCRIPHKKGVHFFLDDYQINRVWEKPVAYIDTLKSFKFVLSPDFSMYRDIPLAVQIWSHYKKHWCAAYWQIHEIRVIPTICWSDEQSYNWCFDGEPRKSIVAVSSVGTQNSKESKELFEKGYIEMMNRLEPCLVLFVATHNYEDLPGEKFMISPFYHRLNPLPKSNEKEMV